MSEEFTIESLYKELHEGLPSSDAKMRCRWARQFLQLDCPLNTLYPLLDSLGEKRHRLMWFISEIGMESPSYLHGQLHDFFAFMLSNSDRALLQAFANYWLIAGVPEQDESIAIDYSLNWIRSASCPIYIKSRALAVMDMMVGKYPELMSEFVLVLEEQAEKHSPSYQNKIKKLLAKAVS